MSFFQTLIILLVLVVAIFTFVREPTTSIKYYKAFGKTTVAGFVWVKDVIVKAMHKEKVVNNDGK